MKPLIVANWKMHFSLVESICYLQWFRENFHGNSHVTFCVPFTALSALRYELQKQKKDVLTIQHRISLGAQHMHYEAEGKFTGEISAIQLKELCDYVLIGHSERRLLFGETDQQVHKKIIAAHHVGLIPIVCFGAFVAEKEQAISSFVEKELEQQMRNCLLGIDMQKKIILAYEPPASIGNGNAANPKRMNHILYFIRRFLAQHFSGAFAVKTILLYGGSVNSSNAKSFLKEKEIDGLLIGTASLDKQEFTRIANLS